MAMTKIKCIHYESEEVVKNGKRKTGVQCLKCKTYGKSFQGSYKNKGSKPETKKMVVKMSVNGSGIRDISRALGISQNTVISVLKKQKKLTNINPKYVNTKEPSWLWHAINHENGEIVAFVLGTRKHDMLRKLYTLLCNLRQHRVYIDKKE